MILFCQLAVAYCISNIIVVEIIRITTVLKVNFVVSSVNLKVLSSAEIIRSDKVANS